MVYGGDQLGSCKSVQDRVRSDNLDVFGGFLTGESVQ